MLKRHHNDVIHHIEDLELILSNPDFVGVNPREKDASFEYVKRFVDNVLVAIKLHKSSDFFYVPTMYRLQDYKLESRIKSGRLRKFDKKVDSARIILTKDIWGQKGSCRTLKKVSEMLGTPTSQVSVISKEGA